jgi:predicted nucleotidyltransferase
VKRASFEAVARALNAAGVPFLVVGGVAVIAHGYGRLTQDVDLVVRLDAESVRRAFHALGQLGYRPLVPVTADGFADAEQRARWMAEKGMTVLSFHSDLHWETRVDVFVSEPFDFADEYQRALTEEITPGVPVRIVRLEALLRLKRAAGRPQDLADIAELKLLHGEVSDA